MLNISEKLEKYAEEPDSKDLPDLQNLINSDSDDSLSNDSESKTNSYFSNRSSDDETDDFDFDNFTDSNYSSQKSSSSRAQTIQELITSVQQRHSDDLDSSIGKLAMQRVEVFDKIDIGRTLRKQEKNSKKNNLSHLVSKLDNKRSRHQNYHRNQEYDESDISEQSEDEDSDSEETETDSDVISITEANYKYQEYKEEKESKKAEKEKNSLLSPRKVTISSTQDNQKSKKNQKNNNPALEDSIKTASTNALISNLSSALSLNQGDMSTVLNQLIDNSSNTSGYNLITEEKLEDLKLRCAQEQSRLLKEAMDMRQKRRDNLNHRLNKLLVTIQSDESSKLKFENSLQSSSNISTNFKHLTSPSSSSPAVKIEKSEIQIQIPKNDQLNLPKNLYHRYYWSRYPYGPSKILTSATQNNWMTQGNLQNYDYQPGNKAANLENKVEKHDIKWTNEFYDSQFSLESATPRFKEMHKKTSRYAFRRKNNSKYCLNGDSFADLSVRRLVEGEVLGWGLD